MSSQFDNAQAAIHDMASLPDDEFLAQAKALENALVKECLLNSGDREFPEDLRQKIVGHVALFTLGYEGMEPTKKGIDWLLSVRSSKLIELLHNDFHDVATRRIKTRFGILSDRPSSNLARSDEYDGVKIGS